MKWLLYGAYGYTGRLIAEEAVKRGLRPVLAGRDGEKTRSLAENLGLEYRVFSLDEPSGIRVRTWCEAENDAGETVRLEMTTPNGYTFTARSAVSAVEWIAGTDSSRISGLAGFQTPASAFGAGFVDEIEGAKWIERGSVVARKSDGGGGG